MAFNPNKYPIERRYINKRSNVRPGTKLVSGKPKFAVAHDTGNPGASADAHFNYFQTLVGRSASAHTFIDDKKILEIIPTGTGPDAAERAWHVRYNVTIDNRDFGDDANDIAIGVELCYGKAIAFPEAYARYVWYFAYLCNKFNMDPLKHIPTHKQLDPGRKFDCEQGLQTGGKTLKQFIYDVKSELESKEVAPIVQDFTPMPVSVATALNDNYVRPAWKSMKDANEPERAQHFANLAANLRSAAGVDEKGNKITPVKLHKSNAQEIIVLWLSPGWYKADTPERKLHFNNLANYLRQAAGIPTE